MPAGLIGNYEELSDEETPLNQEIYGGSRRSAAETTKAWDSFRNLPPGSNSLSEETADYMGVTVKILKVVTYLLTFCIVLGCAVITKGLVLIMTSQLQAKKKLVVCSDNYKALHNEKDYEATIPPLENVAWAWALFFCFIIPELGTWFRSTRMCLFKSWKKPLPQDFFFVFLFETCHVTGTALLIFKVLPDLDVIKGAMLTNCFCFIPGLFGLFSRNKSESRLFLKIIIDIIALAFQISGFFVWPLIEHRKNPENGQVWLIPVAIFLTSFGWWENYVDKQSKFRPIKFLGRIKERMWKSRYFMYIFVSLWKCLVFFGCMIMFMYTRLNDISVIFQIGDALSSHVINVTELRAPLASRLPDIGQVVPLDNIIQISSDGSTPVTLFLLQVLTAYLSYIFAKFACKICIQGFSFSFPVNLTVPVSISLLISACGLRLGNQCYFESIPSYLFWECKGGDILEEFLSEDYAWMWLFWLLSQTWITLHIWTPKCERLASTEKLFVAPMYNALFIDQSLALNRRRDDEAEVKTDDINLNADEGEPEPQYYETISNHTDSSNANNSKSKSSDHITRIYATCTMWHETEEEMMEMLKSILRMDEDQSARRITQKYLEVVDPDYYEFETHVFFDDAFEISDENEDEHVVNSFVRLLVDKIDQAATHVHQITIRIRPPKKFPAPYGGRLVWTLPGKTKIICHMKDKDKIRHKKRWSQVMYMYYLLGFRLMELPIPVDRKELIAENTYLLTLDGDIDFTPKAVTLLVDLMKKNTNLGAACGRIHPVGSGSSGIMVWYQMFEYAIGHWLQKATEHMIGCVMCSPGCFSLFRGKALMDDNVMAKYTTKSSQARHYVQYDQGEDRWLCTLLLQRGYRVEYSAASDAYTHCPEGFGEFYNQRRRWVPSTMANIMDLLQDYKKTIKINDNISLPYIAYQTTLIVGTIIGPGTIFLMLVGAFVAAFKIGNWPSFQYNIYPILMFMVICFTLKSSHQVIVAQIMSASYGLIMMAVIVGTTLQLGEDGIGSPSAIFLIALSGSFFIAACMHPQEFNCIIPGLLYLLSIPSMYLLLIIYSLINLNNVSWGTREVATKKTKREQEADRKAAEEAKKKQKAEGLLGFLYRDQSDEDEGSIELSVAGLFKIMFCVHPKPDDRKHVAEALDELKKQMDSITANLGIGGPPHRKRSDHQSNRIARTESIQETGEDSFDDEYSEHSGPKVERDDLVNPFWLEDKCLKRGVVGHLDKIEIQFWKDLLEKYLYPLNKNVEEQARIAVELKELRNKSVFTFFMLNALFILIVFLLQLNKDEIHVMWPLGVKENVTIIEETGQILISKTYLQLEPIGLVFVFFFALILLIQFTAMLFHRFGTISHILASTELNFCSKKAEEITPESKLESNAVRLVKDMQRLKGFDGSGDGDEAIGNRHPIMNIERHRQKKQPIGTLDVAFMKRFYSISKENGEEGTGTPVLGGERRENLRALFEKRKSKVQTLDFRKDNHTRPSIASEADNQRVFTPNGGSVNEGYESGTEIYGAPPSYRSSNGRLSRGSDQVIYSP